MARDRKTSRRSAAKATRSATCTGVDSSRLLTLRDLSGDRSRVAFFALLSAVHSSLLASLSLQGRSLRFCSATSCELLRSLIMGIERCPDGEIGRRKGLKIPRPQGHAGSIPAPGTSICRVCSGSRVFGRAGRELACNPYVTQSRPICGLHGRVNGLHAVGQGALQPLISYSQSGKFPTDSQRLAHTPGVRKSRCRLNA